VVTHLKRVGCSPIHLVSCLTIDVERPLLVRSGPLFPETYCTGRILQAAVATIGGHRSHPPISCSAIDACITGSTVRKVNLQPSSSTRGETRCLIASIHVFDLWDSSNYLLLFVSYAYCSAALVGISVLGLLLKNASPESVVATAIIF